jgi:hypothetical protein
VLAHAGMLSWSAESQGIEWDPASITDPTVDPLLEGGRELVALVDATHGADEAAIAAPRAALRDRLGDEATVDTAAVIGNFNQMNRLADATGMPVGPGTMRRTEQLRAETGITRFHAHTP